MRLVEVANFGSIPNSWLGIVGSWKTASLLALRAAVDAQHVDPNDIPAVTEVWRMLVSDGEARMKELRAEASKDHQEYRARAQARTAEMEKLGALSVLIPKR